MARRNDSFKTSSQTSQANDILRGAGMLQEYYWSY